MAVPQAGAGARLALVILATALQRQDAAQGPKRAVAAVLLLRGRLRASLLLCSVCSCPGRRRPLMACSKGHTVLLTTPTPCSQAAGAARQAQQQSSTQGGWSARALSSRVPASPPLDRCSCVRGSSALSLPSGSAGLSWSRGRAGSLAAAGLGAKVAWPPADAHRAVTSKGWGTDSGAQILAVTGTRANDGVSGQPSRASGSWQELTGLEGG